MEVLNVLFKIQGDATGAQQAFDKATQAAAAFEVRMEAAQRELEQASQTFATAQATWTSFGVSVDQVTGQLQQYAAVMQQQGPIIAQLEAEHNKLESQLQGVSDRIAEAQSKYETMNTLAEATGKITDQEASAMQGLQDKIASLTAERELLAKQSQDVQDRLNEEVKVVEDLRKEVEPAAVAYADMTDAAEKLDRAQKKLNSTQRSAPKLPGGGGPREVEDIGRKFQRNATLAARYFQTLRTGNIQQTAFSDGLRAVGGGLSKMSASSSAAVAGMVGLAAAAVIVIGVIVGLSLLVGKLAKDFFGLADSINKTNQSFTRSTGLSDLSDKMKQVAAQANITNAEMKQTFSTINTELAGLGVSNSTGLTERVAELAQFTRFMNGLDFSSNARAIQQALAGNVNALNQLGLPVETLKELKLQLASMPGYWDAATRAQVGYNLIQDATQASVEKIRSGMEASVVTFEDVKNKWARIKEEIADRLAPAIDELATKLVLFLQQATPALLALAKVFLVFAKVAIGAIELVGKGMELLAKQTEGGLLDMDNGLVNFIATGLLLKGPLSLIDGLGDAMGEAGKTADDFGAAIAGLNIDEYLGSLSNLTALDDFETDLSAAALTAEQWSQRVVSSFERVSALRQAGFGLASSYKAMREAFDAWEKSSTPENAMAFWQSFEQFQSLAITKGKDGLAELQTWLNQLASMGAPAELLAQMQAIIDEVANAAGKAADGHEDVAGAAQHLNAEAARADEALTGVNTSMHNAGAAAEGATGQVNGLIQALSEIPSYIPVTIAVNMTGGGNVSFGWSGGAAFGGATVNTRSSGGRPSPMLRKSGTPTTALAQQAVGGHGGRRPRTFSGVNVASDEALNALKGMKSLAPGLDTSKIVHGLNFGGSNIFGGGSGGGGGGGGGGDQQATIEEIRKLIQTVNEAIRIGVSGGVSQGFSGNVISQGLGPDDYLTRDESGNLAINTLIIKGVWDFADPAAKRKIIKELESALSSLKSEV